MNTLPDHGNNGDARALIQAETLEMAKALGKHLHLTKRQIAALAIIAEYRQENPLDLCKDGLFAILQASFEDIGLFGDNSKDEADRDAKFKRLAKTVFSNRAEDLADDCEIPNLVHLPQPTCYHCSHRADFDGFGPKIKDIKHNHIQCSTCVSGNN